MRPHPVAALVSLAASLPAAIAWFVFAVRRWQMPRGYNIAFAAYWLACAAAAVAFAGPHALGATLVPRMPSALQLGVLALPVAGAIGFALVPQVRGASRRLIAVAVGRAAVNAFAEELFWRALFVATFPTSIWLGWLAPAAAFALFHVAPLRAAGGVEKRHAGFLVGAVLIGVGYGWVAFSTGSVIFTIFTHTLVDACGIDAARVALGLPHRPTRCAAGPTVAKSGPRDS